MPKYECTQDSQGYILGARVFSRIFISSVCIKLGICTFLTTF